MMYRDSSFGRWRSGGGNWRLQLRVLIALCIALIVAVAVLSVSAVRSSQYKNQSETQLQQRMITAVSAAIDEVNRMDSIVTSNTPARLARVRQYVYHMEQLNALSMALNGGEAGRRAPADAFTALYADLDSLDSIIQASKTSTQDGRTTLLAHLVLLQNHLTGQ